MNTKEFRDRLFERGVVVTTRTISNWCQAGRIGTRIGKRWQFSEEDIEKAAPRQLTDVRDYEDWLKGLSQSLGDLSLKVDELQVQRPSNFLPIEVGSKSETGYTHESPSGSVEWYDDRYYKVTVDNEVHFLPSVTTLLKTAPKPFLDRMRGDLGNHEMDRRMNEAAERGTRIHDACGTLCLGGIVIFQTPSNRYSAEEIRELESQHGRVSILYKQDEMLNVEKFHRWLKSVNPIIQHVELTVFSLEKQYAGTLDFVFDIEPGVYEVNGAKPIKLGGRYIADLKTGKAIVDSYHWQTAAYQKAMEETGLSFDGRMIIHTGSETRTGIPGLSTIVRGNDLIEDDFLNFQSAQRLWLASNNNKPRVHDVPLFLSYTRAGVTHGLLQD